MTKGLPDDKYIETLEAEISAYLERIRELEERLANAESELRLYRQFYESEKQENTKLREELKLRRHQMSRFPFCPDHRDKVHGLECRECEIEKLRAELVAAWASRDWDRVNMLLREKDELNRMLKEAQCRLI